MYVAYLMQSEVLWW